MKKENPSAKHRLEQVMIKELISGTLFGLWDRLACWENEWTAVAEWVGSGGSWVRAG
jgi:hypothetical protein